MPSRCTCTVCGKLIGCCGWLPCDEEAPLYAESRMAAVARAMSPGIAVHFLRFVIAMKYVTHALRACVGLFEIARAWRALPLLLEDLIDL